MKSEDRQQKLDDYFMGRLSDEERQGLEASLEQSDELKSDFNLMALEYEVKEALHEEDLKRRMQSWKEEDDDGPPPPDSGRKGQPLWLFFLFFLVIGFSLYTLWPADVPPAPTPIDPSTIQEPVIEPVEPVSPSGKQTTPLPEEQPSDEATDPPSVAQQNPKEKLDYTYAKDAIAALITPKTVNTLSSDEESEDPELIYFANILKAFENGDNQEVIDLINAQAIDNTNLYYYNTLEYKGLALFRLSRYEEAIATFDQILASDDLSPSNIFHNRASLNAALATLASGQLTKAKKRLEVVAKDDRNTIRKKAQELLKIINH